MRNAHVRRLPAFENGRLSISQLSSALLVKLLAERLSNSPTNPTGPSKLNFSDSLDRGKFTLSSVEPSCKH